MPRKGLEISSGPKGRRESSPTNFVKMIWQIERFEEREFSALNWGLIGGSNEDDFDETDPPHELEEETATSESWSLWNCGGLCLRHLRFWVEEVLDALDFFETCEDSERSDWERFRFFRGREDSTLSQEGFEGRDYTISTNLVLSNCKFFWVEAKRDLSWTFKIIGKVAQVHQV